MKPRLVAISGPREGQTIALSNHRLSIGRQADNDLQLAGIEVSRRHCEIVRGTDGTFTVVDLGSRHGVFVNSRPVREKRLVHSDLVTIGGSVLLLMLDESGDDLDSGADASGRGHPFSAGSTIARKPTEMLYLDRARVEAALPGQARIARDLHVLLRAATRLQGPLDLGKLAKRLLEAVGDSIPATRSAVMLCEAGSQVLTPAAVWTVDAGDGNARDSDARSPSEARFPPTAEMLGPVLEGKTGLLSVPDGSDPIALADGCVLAVPLLGSEDDVLGAVYCNAPLPTLFDERHLELLGALAGVASLAFQNALHLRWLQRENRRLRADQLAHEMVGESPPMQRLFALIDRAARAETTILVRGESGTGKELAAQAIHRASGRAEGPFVAINCATLSETLFESELFGHEKGAFTGAAGRAIGKLEAAAGGTLFLDEVGEIPPSLQAKLLRVLQERQFFRVGGSRAMAADVRIVAATNRDLEAAIRDGGFRDDLYYRLKVITLEIPPLRQRRDDIPLLASHFLALHGRQLGRRGVALSPATRRCLLAYEWPGNIRELGNVLERALVLGESEVVCPEDLPDEVVEGSTDIPSSFQVALHDFKQKLILEAYRKAGRDYGTTAELLGVHINSLHRMIRRLGLKERLES